MEPFDSIEKLITEHGSATIQRSHIALLKEQMTHLASENKELKTKVSAFEIEVRQLRRQLQDNQTVAQPGESCPYCRRTTGQLVELTKHPVFFMQGWKVGHYKCSNPQCGKTYEHDLEH